MNLLDSLGSLRSLTAGPWIYPVVATSILLDVFLPVLPSGFLVITAATAATAATATAASPTCRRCSPCSSARPRPRCSATSSRTAWRAGAEPGWTGR